MRIASFDEKADDQQQDITNALAFVSAVDIGDDPEQVEVSIEPPLNICSYIQTNRV